MSATEIVEEIRRLPHEEQIQVMGRLLAEQSREDFDRILRQRQVNAFNEMCALVDASDHAGKGMTEEEIIALSMREKLS